MNGGLIPPPPLTPNNSHLRWCSETYRAPPLPTGVPVQLFWSQVKFKRPNFLFGPINWNKGKALLVENAVPTDLAVEMTSAEESNTQRLSSRWSSDPRNRPISVRCVKKKLWEKTDQGYSAYKIKRRTKRLFFMCQNHSYLELFPLLLITAGKQLLCLGKEGTTYRFLVLRLICEGIYSYSWPSMMELVLLHVTMVMPNSILNHDTRNVIFMENGLALTMYSNMGAIILFMTTWDQKQSLHSKISIWLCFNDMVK